MADVGCKPNILLIMADQLIPFLTGAYGHPVVKTPNLDRLVREGIRFDAAYTPCPLCVPARACLMTGQHASDIRCNDNASPLASDEPTFAHYLSYVGYDTALSGKMHFIGPDQLHGFGTRLTTDIYSAGFMYAPMRKQEHGASYLAHPHASNYATPKVGVARWTMYLDYDEETHFRALQYLYSHRRTEGDAHVAHQAAPSTQPFFLCVSYHHPHEPFVVTKELWDLYDGEEIELPQFPPNLDQTYSAMDRWLNAFHGCDLVPHLKSPESLYVLRRSYYGLVSYIDTKVGELLNTMERAGLRDNTIVIFTSDHGDMLCEKGMVQKRTFYEWSSRVPLIIAFPDGWRKGTVCETPVSLIDLAPTLLDMAGVPVADRLPMAGKSLIGLMDGSDSDDRVVFSEYHVAGVYAPCFMIRRGQYKYIYVHGHDAQLFDLHNDPGEWHNLSGKSEYAALAADLRARILAQFDPDAIERDIVRSVPKRLFLRKVMQQTGTRWDYTPIFDGREQGVR